MIRSILALLLLFSISQAFASFTQVADISDPRAPSVLARPNIHSLAIHGDNILSVANSGTYAGNGVVIRYGGIYNVSKSSGSLKWKVALERFSFSMRPVIYKNQVIALSSDAKLYFIDLESGKILNVLTLLPNFNVNTDMIVGIQPVIYQDKLYLAANKLWAVDLSTRSIVWTFNEPGMPSNFNEVQYSLLLYKGLLIYPCDQRLCAVSAQTGRPAWKLMTIERFRSIELDSYPGWFELWGNAKVDLDGNLVFLSSRPMGIIKVDPLTGMVIDAKRFDIEHSITRSAGHNELLLMSSGYMAKTIRGEIIMIDRETLEPTFIKLTNSSIYMMLSSFGDNALAVDDNKVLHVINGFHGRVVRRFQLPTNSSNNESLWSHLVFQGNSVYFGTNQGRIFRLDI